MKIFPKSNVSMVKEPKDKDDILRWAKEFHKAACKDQDEIRNKVNINANLANLLTLLDGTITWDSVLTLTANATTDGALVLNI